jgi:hypothetical protein
MQKMMLFVLLIPVIITLFNCSKHNYNQFPLVGEQLPDSAIYINKAFYSSNDKDSTYVFKILINRLLFYLEADKNKKIVSIFTGDTNFVVPEGIRVGDNGLKVKQLGKLVNDGSTLCEYELPSKWRVVLKKLDTLKIGSPITYSNDPEKLKVITIRKYKE